MGTRAKMVGSIAPRLRSRQSQSRNTRHADRMARGENLSAKAGGRAALRVDPATAGGSGKIVGVVSSGALSPARTNTPRRGTGMGQPRLEMRRLRKLPGRHAPPRPGFGWRNGDDEHEHRTQPRLGTVHIPAVPLRSW